MLAHLSPAIGDRVGTKQTRLKSDKEVWQNYIHILMEAIVVKHILSGRAKYVELSITKLPNYQLILVLNMICL